MSFRLAQSPGASRLLLEFWKGRTKRSKSNGGPAMPLGDSGVAEGLPSVRWFVMNKKGIQETGTILPQLIGVYLEAVARAVYKLAPLITITA